MAKTTIMTKNRLNICVSFIYELLMLSLFAIFAKGLSRLKTAVSLAIIDVCHDCHLCHPINNISYEV